MQTKSKLLTGTAIAALGMGVAQANVIYNFNPDADSGGPFVQADGGKLVVTDAAYRSGSARVAYNAPRFGDLPSPRISPIVSASLSAVTVFAAGGFGPGVGVGPFVSVDTPRLVGSTDSLAADLTFNNSGGLDGSLFLQSEENQASASGSGDNWRVFDVGSDFFVSGPCTNSDLCDAGTGRWQVDRSTLPGSNPAGGANAVPAPPVWSLFGLAVLGFFGFAKRRIVGISNRPASA